MPNCHCFGVSCGTFNTMTPKRHNDTQGVLYCDYRYDSNKVKHKKTAPNSFIKIKKKLRSTILLLSHKLYYGLHTLVFTHTPIMYECTLSSLWLSCMSSRWSEVGRWVDERLTEGIDIKCICWHTSKRPWQLFLKSHATHSKASAHWLSTCM